MDKALKIRREIKLASLFIATLLLFIWGINYLKGKDIFTRQIAFYTVYDHVSGLLESNPVTISGVTIGQVDRIAFHPDGSGRVVLTAVVDRKINIPDNSIAVIAATDIFGFKELQIILGDSPNYIQRGDTLEGDFQPSIGEALANQFEPFSQQAKGLVSKADSLLTSINKLLHEENQTNLNKSIEHLRKSLETFEQSGQRLDHFMESEAARIATILAGIESVTNNIEDNNEDIAAIINNLSEFTDVITGEQFAAIVQNTGETFSELRMIMEKINKGEGNAGMLLADDSLYHNLKESAIQLELLLEDIRKNPKKYFNITVFGR